MANSTYIFVNDFTHTIEEGALADLLLVNVNPLENINLVSNPETNFVVIMKDGVFYKNTVAK